MRVQVSIPKLPNACAKQCMLKSNIYFNSQGREKYQKNKFRTEESIGSLIDTKFVEHKTCWITTSISNALQRSLLKKTFNQGITLMRVSELPNNIWNYHAD
jgi:hypothetical protein